MIGAILAFLLQTASATDFTSTFLAFEMPSGFSCKKNVGTYICLNASGPKMKDEIIVISFKRAGPQDSLEQYLSQMRQPRSIRDRNKMSLLSQVLSAAKFTANAVPWVESRHHNGEIQDYFTSYWVTKVGGVGMLISYSAHQNKKAEWLRQSEIIRNSLSVDGSAAAAVTKQAAGTTHPDLDELHDGTEEGGVIANTHGSGRSAGTPTGGQQRMFSLNGTISIGGMNMKKSHFYLGIAALVVLLLAGAALKKR